MDSDTAFFGFGTTIIAIGIVLLALAVLAVLISLLVKFLAKDKGKKSGDRTAADKIPVAGEKKAAAPEHQTVPAPETGINAKTVAAVMAAISASSGRPLANLRFTSIKRKNYVNYKWAEAGKTEIIDSKKFYI